MKKRTLALVWALLAFSTVANWGCKDNNDAEEIEQLKKDALANYANLVLAGYDDSFFSALVLQQKIEEFLANPTDIGFQACKEAWLAARNPYGQTEAFRFYGGPIDDADGPEGLINAWPMDENFIDYTSTQPNAGLINDPVQYPEINKTLLESLNESLTETSIFTGYHAIEFLLWGQDLSTDGPGQRLYTDYVTGAGGTAANQMRRAQYLRAVTELLLENLGEVRSEWVNGSPFRTQLLTETSTAKALGYLFTSLGELSKGELSGERMFVAIDTKDQENEHSCFSDNTVNDIKMNFQGLKNVYFGTYARTNGATVSGVSVSSVAEKVDRAKADAARAAFADAEAKINAIPEPFDQTIVNSPETVLPAIEALRTLSDRLADVGLALGAEF